MDDYEAWRGFLRSVFQKQPAIEIVGEPADGLETVDKAEQLQPDLILLDIGFPRLNGIEAAPLRSEVENSVRQRKSRS